METLALESEKIAHELIDVLTSIRIAGKASRFKSFSKAIDSVWKARKIAETKRRLDQVQKAIQLCIQMSIRDDQIIMQSTILQSLDGVSRITIEVVLQGTGSLIKHQEASNALASARHTEILDIVQYRRDRPIPPNYVLDRIKARLYHHRQDDR